MPETARSHGPGLRAGVSRRRPGARAVPLGVLAVVLASLCSCAYYNTYYLARKYYLRGTGGAPYPVESSARTGAADFNKAIDYSKKVLAQYPKSKWVDDAYLMWAQALLGKDDPIQTVNMLQDFTTRFPRSPLRPEALFFLGVANRQARRYVDALSALDEFLRNAPRHSLVPHAHYERARALVSLERPAEAAEAASRIVERYPKSTLVPKALALRAEARLAHGDYEPARADFRALGTRALNDEERLGFLLREADCLEAGRQYDQELALLRDALSHEREALPPDTTGGKPLVAAGGPTAQRWGRLMVRVGNAQVLAGRLTEALSAYERVVRVYPKTELAAEAQYRIGFGYETVAEDFDKARAEYRRVRDQMGSGSSFTLADQRLGNLDRLAQYRTPGGDTLQKSAEAGLLLAELYLFTHGKPERALEEYRGMAQKFSGTSYGAKAMNAEAWVLSRKLDRKAEAESLFWRVVREYPATEEQLAARDYLEAAGQMVPDRLIKPPKPKPRPLPPPPDTSAAQPAGRAGSPAFGEPSGPSIPVPDSLRLGIRRPGGALSGPGQMQAPLPFVPPRPAGRDSGAFGDSLNARVFPPRAALPVARADSIARAAARDTAHAVVRADTTRRAAAPRAGARDTARSVARADTTRRTAAPRAAARDTARAGAGIDTTRRIAAPRAAARDTGRTVARADTTRRSAPPRPVAPDTVRSAARADTTRRSAPPRLAPRDTTHSAARADTTKRSAVKPAKADTSRLTARADTTQRIASKAAPRDTSRATAKADTTKRRVGKPARRDTTHSSARRDTTHPSARADTAHSSARADTAHSSARADTAHSSARPDTARRGAGTKK